MGISYDIVELLVKNDDIDLILWFGNHISVAGINDGEDEEGLLECEKVPVMAYSLEGILADGLSSAIDNERGAEIVGYLHPMRALNRPKLTALLEGLQAILLNHRMIQANPDGTFSHLNAYPENDQELAAELEELEKTHTATHPSQIPFGVALQLAAARYVRANYESFLPRIVGYQVQDLYASIR